MASVRHTLFGLALAAAAPAIAPAAAHAAALTVAIDGLVPVSSGEQVGCALFASADGFPSDRGKALAVQQASVSSGEAVCRFEGLADGAYAVAILQDLDGDWRADRDFLGRPTEPWGVSNNVRAIFRAPSFADAAVTLAGAAEVRIQIRLVR